MVRNIRLLSCLFVIAILFPMGSSAQSGWYHLPSPGNLNTIFFVDSVTGWAGGSSGIYISTDGGSSWNPQTLPIVTTINRIVFLTSSVGFAVGEEEGTILKTTDSGATWTQKRSGTPLRSIFFLNSQLGWACGIDTVLFTTDYGETWSSRSVPSIHHADISFRNSQEGWVVGYYQSCFRSTDGGNNWFSVSSPIAGRSLFGVCFPTSSRGIIIGGEQIALSTNAGSSWISVYNSGGDQLNSVSFADSLNGWVVGSYKIVKTTDGGDTWFEQSWPAPQAYLTDVHCSDNEHAWAIGVQIFLRTTNGGVTSVRSSSDLMPHGTALYQNHPNPFNPTTTIRYTLPRATPVTLEIYTVTGQEVRTLVNRLHSPGEYSVVWDGTDQAGKPVSSGIYIYRLEGGEEYVQSRKMLLIR